jgi:hypothetical protein
VRAEDDGCAAALLGRERVEGRRHARCEEGDERRVVVIGADVGERRPATLIGNGLLHALDVRLNRHARPMRRHDDADGSVDAVASHPFHRLRDERRRMLHAEVGTESTGDDGVAAEALDEALRLGARRVEQREHVADRGVAVAELLKMLRRRRPATTDVGVVALDVVRPARGAVRHDENAGRARHSALIRSTVFGAAAAPSRSVSECTRSTTR